MSTTIFLGAAIGVASSPVSVSIQV